MAAFPVCAQLGLIQTDKSQVGPNRHGLGRAEQPAGVFGFDPLLTGDQRDPVSPLDRADPVVDFARQQPQRKADRAG